jgi:uncharacterized SAM-binding protein YcdF (DUF218 family)
VKRLLLRLVLRLLAIAAILLLAFSVYALPRLGRFLVAEDPLTKADVIYVLSGARFERMLEAVDLYKEGWAPKVMLAVGVYDWGEVELRDKGIPYPREAEIQVQVMGQLGVPPQDIIVLDQQDSTHEEAMTLLGQARMHHWSTVIVVTSKQHTRRARMEMNRTVAPQGVKVIMRATRHDRSDVDRWWANRGTLRFTLFETQRLLAYWLHLAY